MRRQCRRPNYVCTEHKAVGRAEERWQNGTMAGDIGPGYNIASSQTVTYYTVL